MPVLSATNISKYYGNTKIIESLSFSVDSNQRVGIVGPNGAGKSTLLHIISGKLNSDSGDFFVAKDLSLGFLPQNTMLDSSKTLIDEMYGEFQDVLGYELTQRELEHKMATLDYESKEYAQVTENYSRITQLFEDANGYEIDSRIKGTLIGLGFSTDSFQQHVNTFSGGQKTRAALCKMLVRNPDILLLDEPTNHLDLNSLQWLGNYLASYNGTIVMVSHDRYTLDSVCDTIFEISNTKLHSYTGNYSDYIKKKMQLEKDQLKHFSLQQKEIKRQKQIIEKYRSFNREKSIKAAESREKQLNKIELVDAPDMLEHINLAFNIAHDSAGDVLHVDSLSKSFDSLTVFNAISFDVKKNERIGLIGSNAAGKSTLLKIIAGTLSQDKGNVSIGARVSMGYFDQQHATLDPKSSILNHVHDAFPDKNELDIRNTLASLLFKGDDVYKEISTLSGGEKSRVEFAKLMLGEFNFILLDEPTNHLDMASREILESAFNIYEGTLLFVSHDRYFINKIAERILVLENASITDYRGNYDYYINRINRPSLDKSKEKTKQSKTQTAIDRKKERQIKQAIKAKAKQIEALEIKIDCLETRKKELETLLSLPETYNIPEEMMKLQTEYQTIQENLDITYDEWTLLCD